MSVSEDEIRKVADLADLNLTQAEIKQYAIDMNDILEFMEVLDGVDVSNQKIVLDSQERYNHLRKDEVKPHLSQEEALKNAPSQEEGLFHLPKVIKS